MGQRARLSSLSELNCGSQLIGKHPEYFEDFYFFRNRIFRSIEKYFFKINPVGAVKKTLGSIGFDSSKILFDTSYRPIKFSSPICFFVKIPGGIRVLYKNESPYFNLQSCYPETGNAIHASSIDPKYWPGKINSWSYFLSSFTLQIQ